MLISITMLFSLPWAYPSWGTRLAIELPHEIGFESTGFYALSESVLVCAAVGLLLIGIGGRASGALYQKEAMAVVGFAWILATVLGGLPFYLSGAFRGPSMRVNDDLGYVYVHRDHWFSTSHWIPKYELSYDQRDCVKQLIDAGATGIPRDELDESVRQTLTELAKNDADFAKLILFPDGKENGSNNFRILWLRMSFVDSLFESQSGFSTTGATVISDLEDPRLVPHCILFWRSSTHFLGGLGIIVLFVAILGRGSAGKALMRNEVPGPSQESAEARMQHTARVFAMIYVVLTITLAALLKVFGLSWFDALCHSFGTLATGGFSTYNASLGHFDSALIDGVTVVFMILAGMNFTLLYFLFRGMPSAMVKDPEWRTYIGIIAAATCTIVLLGFSLGEFTDVSGQPSWFASLRYGLFQVVSIMTTTGYGTHDFEEWNSLSRCILFLLMFVGGCAGSTGGGIKVVRWLLLTKILGLELERAHHPRVIRTLRMGQRSIDDDALPKNILVYFCVIGVIFAVSWLIVVGIEPEATWAGQQGHKLVDSASAVAATLNNIGPGFGTVGPTQNYGHFSVMSKLLFTLLMMLGRVEVFAILVLLMPSFWRAR